MIIAIDIDGVCRNFVGSLQRTYKRYNPDYEIVPVTDWGLEKFFPIGSDIYDWGFKTHSMEVFGQADIYPGTVESLQQLNEIHSLVALTIQSSINAVHTIMWLKKHGLLEIFTKVDIIINNSTSHGKGKELTNYDLYVDDSPKNLEMLIRNGKQVICRDQLYNRNLKCDRDNWPVPRINTLAELPTHPLLIPKCNPFTGSTTQS